jgi:hypothetical protein
LRWAATFPEDLAKALENRFQGIGSPDSVEPVKGPTLDWGFHDRVYGIHSDHTGMAFAKVTREDAHRKLCKALIFLTRKLLADLESGEKIFVYKVRGDLIAEDVLCRIAQAIRSYGSRFLFVKRAANPEELFQVRKIHDGFYVGSIDRFLHDDRNLGHNYTGWERVCRQALDVMSR